VCVCVSVCEREIEKRERGRERCAMESSAPKVEGKSGSLFLAMRAKRQASNRVFNETICLFDS